MKAAVTSVLLGLLGAGCGWVRANSQPQAVHVLSPLPGYTCFAVLNASGDAVGGNCVRE